MEEEGEERGKKEGREGKKEKREGEVTDRCHTWEKASTIIGDCRAHSIGSCRNKWVVIVARNET